MACRNREKAEVAAREIRLETRKAKVKIMQLDLTSLESIHQFAEVFKTRYERLDVLTNNAGIMNVPYAKSVDGFESQFGTNHLGHFALTGLLLDLIRSTPGARVVNVSSIGHRGGVMDFDNLMYENGRGYDGQGAYARSKLANLLFTYELQRFFVANGIDAQALAAHPGLSNTSLADHNWLVKILRPVLGMLIQSAAMGALPTLRAAVDPGVKGGQYYGPRGRSEWGGYPVIVQSNSASHSMVDARTLWQVSEELTSVRYLSNGMANHQ
jgi:NAD(P)-dependent dehydrogenase (short-subunit alcohol dehydrogenase family)